MPFSTLTCRPLGLSLRTMIFALSAIAGLGAVLAILAAPATASAQEMTVATARGEVTIPADPKTVLVFDLTSIDTLDALGVTITGVPTARYPDYLTKYNSNDVTKIGSLFEPDFEAVNAMKPDLIITGGRSRSQTDALAKIAPTIDMTVDAKNFLPEAFMRIETLGRIFMKEDEAREAIASLKASIETLNSEASDVGTGLIVLTTGNRISAFGPGSRFGVLHEGFGVKAADEGLDTANHGESVSFEYIADTNPDWLFVIDRDAAIGRGAAASLLENELVENTRAWRANHVVYLNPATWYLTSSGLQAMQINVDQLTKRFAKGS